jgi:hypothetical protein
VDEDQRRPPAARVLRGEAGGGPGLLRAVDPDDDRASSGVHGVLLAADLAER